MKVSPFVWLALSFFGYYCAYGIFVPYFPVWLKSQQYSSEIIGVILASAYVFRFAGGLWFSAWIKQASQLLNGLRLLALASAAVTAAMGVMGDNLWLLCAALGLFAMVNAGGMTLSDSLATTWQRQIQLDYGKARLIGSAAFVVGVTLFGQLIGVFGEPNIIWILTAVLCVYTLLQGVRPSIPPRNEPLAVEVTAAAQHGQSAVKNSDGFFALLKDRTTLRVLLAVSLIQGSHAAYYGYSTLYWTNQGLSVSQTGMLWGVGVLAEILLFFYSRRLFQSQKISTIFYLATAAALLRWSGLAFITDFWLLLPLQMLHAFTYAAAHYAMMRYISSRPQPHIAKLQGLYNGIANSAVVALLMAVSGMIFPFSPPIMFGVMFAVAALAFVVIPRQVQGFLTHETGKAA